MPSQRSKLKIYSAQGTLIASAGKKGGRPLRGAFDEQAMMRVSSVAVDSKDRIWATENWEYPRRISVWGKDGKLVRDYVGNTGYAGTGCFLHDEDPTLGYVGPIEIQLDHKARSWKVKQILWLPDPARGESFEVHPSNHIGPHIITTAVSGKKRSYLYAHERSQVIYQQRGAAWQPVAAVCLVGHFSGKINRGNVLEEEPSGEFAGLHAFDGCFWNDTNGDGKIQRSECVIVPSPKQVPVGKRGNPGLPLGNGWGGRLGHDLSFWADGLVRYRPIGFTDDGAPIYGPKGMIVLPLNERGDLVPVTEEKLLLNMSSTGYGRLSTLMGLDDTSAEIRWTYPCHYHGVHGSHNAVMPKPGMIIGGLKICGVARVNDQVGNVLLIRGNLGQDYVLTTDGLFVGSLFQDARLPNESLPAKEIPGMAMDGFTQGQEPFNGWFGRQADGKIRMTTGQAGQAAMIVEVKGLESIQRFQGPSVTVDSATLIKADQENSTRAVRAAQPKSYTIRKLAKPPVIDGNPNDWPKDLPAMTIKRDGTTNQGTVKLGYDDKNLYVLFDVVDATPMLNEGKDYTRLFKTGDAVDLQFATDPSAPAKRANPVAGDVRLVFSMLAKKPAVILMKPIDPTAPSSAKVHYESPVGVKNIDRVEILTEAQIKIKSAGTRYVVEAALPLERLGLAPQSGQSLRGDAGLIFSDAQGTVNVARMYWSNQNTNLNSDEPLEAWLYPLTWGELKFE